jgi:phenylacetic acid degradation operon negative regulatory protein
MDRYVSTVISFPVSYAVYSSLSFFGPHRGGELPGRWFVAALGRVGHDAAAVRQTLWRMEQSGELAGRVDGRQRFYRFTPLAGAEARLGLARIMDPPPRGWDGEWTIVHLRFAAGQRTERERVIAALHAGGFRGTMPGVFLHPRGPATPIEALAEEAGHQHVMVFQGRRAGGPDDDSLARALWDIDALERLYRAFLASWRADGRRRRWRGEQAFAARFALVFSYLDIAWNDPELPAALLPVRWPGGSARALARQLYLRLQPKALRYCERILSRSKGAVPS